jgi:large subunit ribosomal protein L30
VSDPLIMNQPDTGKLRVTWLRSTIGRTKDQELTIRALGLRRMHQTVDVPNVASVRGMVNAVRHLVSVEKIES